MSLRYYHQIRFFLKEKTDASHRPSPTHLVTVEKTFRTTNGNVGIVFVTFIYTVTRTDTMFRQHVGHKSVLSTHNPWLPVS